MLQNWITQFSVLTEIQISSIRHIIKNTPWNWSPGKSRRWTEKWTLPFRIKDVVTTQLSLRMVDADESVSTVVREWPTRLLYLHFRKSQYSPFFYLHISLLLKIFKFLLMCMCICLCSCHVCVGTMQRPEEGDILPGAGVSGNKKWSPWCGCWKLNSDLLTGNKCSYPLSRLWSPE